MTLIDKEKVCDTLAEILDKFERELTSNEVAAMSDAVFLLRHAATANEQHKRQVASMADEILSLREERDQLRADYVDVLARFDPNY